jgi:hypothetical protein
MPDSGEPVNPWPLRHPLPTGTGFGPFIPGQAGGTGHPLPECGMPRGMVRALLRTGEVIPAVITGAAPLAGAHLPGRQDALSGGDNLLPGFPAGSPGKKGEIKGFH